MATKSQTIILGETPLTSNDDSTVVFKAQYPKDYKGEKTLVDGTEYEVEKELAKRFESIGIGEIVKK